MQTFWKTLNILLLTGILAVGVLLVGTLAPIPGNFKVKIVKSGSMEPTIKTGGIVVIKPESLYQVGDIVTFGADTKTQIPTTHRIIEIGDSPLGKSVRTKGDANNAPDSRPTPLSEVHGKVVFTLPYVGYLLDFARKPIGFALLVGLPACAVIVDELGKILREVKRMRRKKNGGESRGDDNTNGTTVSLDERSVHTVSKTPSMKVEVPRRVGLAPIPRKNDMAYTQAFTVNLKRSPIPLHFFFALLLPLTALGALSSVGSTVSYFADVETSIGNYLKADPLGFSAVLIGDSSVDMNSGSQYATAVITPSEDSEPIQYSLSTYVTGGDTTLCGLLNVEATSTFQYSGSLLLLATGMTTTTGALPLHFTLPSGYAASENTSCFVDLIFSARNASANAGEGYVVTQHLPIQFFVPAPVIVDSPSNASAAVVLEEVLDVVPEATSSDETIPPPSDETPLPPTETVPTPVIIEESSTTPPLPAEALFVPEESFLPADPITA